MNIDGDDNANNLTGTAFKDVIDAKGGNDYVSGNGGNDSILGGAGSDQLSGGDGKDTVRGGLETDFINGGAGSEIDYLYGDEGNDIVTVRQRDYADGGDGSDYVAFYLLDLPAVNADLSAWTSGGTFTYAGATLTSFESGLVFFGDGDDKVRAPSFALTVFGGGGKDTLLGGAGSDTLYGIESSIQEADVLKGGDGNDVLYGGAGDVLDGGLGDFDSFELNMFSATQDYDIDFGRVFSGSTTYLGDGGRVFGGERGSLQLGSGDDRVKTGSDATHDGVRVTGGSGNDTLIGGDGDDNMSGDAGDDVLRGGAGLGVDIANYQYEAAAVTIDLNVVGYQDTGGGGFDSLSGIENVYGGQSGDRITGDAGNNRFEGYGGADTLIGGLGNDTLNGGSGTGPEDDRLAGGAGQDLYNGGLGADVLVWSSVSHTTTAAPDQIMGLEEVDIINLKDIDANSTAGGDQAFTVVAAFTGTAGQLRVTFDGLTTSFAMDVNGDGAADGLFQADGDHTAHAGYVL